MTRPMMKCGHTANAKRVIDGIGYDVCAICYGIAEGADVIDTDPPSLAGRVAVCTYADPSREGKPHGKEGAITKVIPSGEAQDQAFFRHQPDQEWDTYYCGCWGWD